MAKLDKIDGRVKKYLQDAEYERWLGLMQQWTVGEWWLQI